MTEDSDEFEDALAFVFKWEGGLSDHPDDPGGITHFGISIKFAGSIKLDINDDGKTDAADIRNLTRDQAADIYYRHFWVKSHCNSIPTGLSLLVFDSAVNMGVRRSIRFLQHAAGTKPDGIWGPNTRAAVAAINDRHSAIREYIARRNKFYGRLGTFKTFGLGWMRRSADAHNHALRALS